MGGLTKCLKVSHIICDVFFWMLGALILAIGIWILADESFANIGEAFRIGSAAKESMVQIVGWIFIGVGIFVFLVGFSGFCGAVKESRVLLGFFIFFVFLVFAVEVGAGIYVFVRRIQIVSNIAEGGSTWVRDSYDYDGSSASRGFTYLQFTFGCCGIRNFTDYKNSNYLNSTKTLPKDAWLSPACCRPLSSNEFTNSIDAANIETCTQEAVTAARLYINGTDTNRIYSEFRTQGCVDKIIQWSDEHLLLLAVPGIVIGGIQVVAIILSCLLCYCGNDYRDEKHL